MKGQKAVATPQPPAKARRERNLWVQSDHGRCEVSVVTSQAAAKAYAWNARKRMFAEEHVRVAWSALERGQWLSSRDSGERTG